MSRWAIDRALRSERLYFVHPGAYSVIPPELLSEDGELIAALIAAGPRARLARATAARRWKLIPARPLAIELGVPHARIAPAGVVLYRLDFLCPCDVATNGRFPTTSVLRTILDVATTFEQRPLVRVLAEAEFQHDVRPDDVLGITRRGHPGSGNLRSALELHVPGYGEAKSALARRFRRLLIRHGIPLPERNQEVGPWNVDCLWRAERVVVEIDGGQHDRPHQRAVDAGRDLWLRGHGFTARRYGPAQIDHTPDALVADLRAALATGRG